MLFLGSAGTGATSGPSGRPNAIDYSVTSAYEPISSPILPNSPLNLQRTTSHRNPPRSSQPAVSKAFNRTFSTGAYPGNGKRPVPAPRPSLGSKSDDYQSIDSTMPDVQIKEGMSPAVFTDKSAFSYDKHPELGRLDTGVALSHSVPSQLARASGSRNINSYGSLDRKQSISTAETGSQYDTASLSASLTSNSMDYRSLRSSKRSNPILKRNHSKTSLTDEEKKERRKSDLLGSSPYPQLVNLADSAASEVTSADALYAPIKKAGWTGANLGAGSTSAAQELTKHSTPIAVAAPPLPHNPSPIYETIPSPVVANSMTGQTGWLSGTHHPHSYHTSVS